MQTGIGEAPKRSPLIRFGDFSFDTSRRTLSRFGIRLKLQKQPFQVLELLILRAPAVVSRDEIRLQLWGDDVNVDTEQNINFCIRQIRSVLEDSATAARFVETVPREGYRFIAKLALPVQIEENAAPVEAAIESPGQATQPVAQSRMRWVKAGAWATVVLLLLAGAGLWLHRSNRPAIPVVAEVSSLTNYPGDERSLLFLPMAVRLHFHGMGKKGITAIFTSLWWANNIPYV